MLSKCSPFPLARALSVAVSIFGCAMLSACAANTSSHWRTSPQSATSSAQPPAQLITQLQQAKALDESALRDPTISVNRRGDLLDHEQAADQTIRDLQHGFVPDQDRINYALSVPPSHLTAAQKTALIQQLKDAIREDDAREQAVVSFGANDMFYQDPNAPSEFGSQEQLAQKQIKALEEGEHVSWDEVQRALYVPPNPL